MTAAELHELTKDLPEWSGLTEWQSPMRHDDRIDDYLAMQAERSERRARFALMRYAHLFPAACKSASGVGEKQGE